MPNLVNQVLLDDLGSKLRGAGSCLIVSFDRLTVGEAGALRTQLREAGMQLRVVKNRLALKAFADQGLDLAQAFSGKCGVVVAPGEDGAISAAKLVRTAMDRRREPPVVVSGGVIEGAAIVGPQAQTIADMPDKQTVRGQLASGIAGVARALAVCVQGAGSSGIARAVQARIDKEDGDP